LRRKKSALLFGSLSVHYPMEIFRPIPECQPYCLLIDKQPSLDGCGSLQSGERSRRVSGLWIF